MSQMETHIKNRRMICHSKLNIGEQLAGCIFA